MARRMRDALGVETPALVSSASSSSDGSLTKFAGDISAELGPLSRMAKLLRFSFYEPKLLLKLIVSLPALFTVVDLTMATGADGTDPTRMVWSAIGKAPRVMRLEVKVTI